MPMNKAKTIAGIGSTGERTGANASAAAATAAASASPGTARMACALRVAGASESSMRARFRRCDKAW